jgi:hypothetical protein
MRLLATANDRSEAVRRTSAAFGMLVVFLLATAAPTSAATPATTVPAAATTIRINPREIWTPTRIVLKKGENVTITATGYTHFGTPPIARIDPDGIPRGPKCAAARAQARQRAGAGSWPAPLLKCWSLIGKIGSFPPFAIGRTQSFGAGAGGRLLVGVNDDQLGDNAGGWVVSIRRSPPSLPAATPSNSKSSSSPLAFIAVAVVGVLAVVALVVVWKRIRSRRTAEPERSPAPASVPTPAAVTVAAGAAAARPAQPSDVAIPPEGEAAAGNILEVALTANRTLRVGYNHFPDATVVHWRITQKSTVMTGDFETDGRSAAEQVVTVPLESALDAADAADIAFTWAVGGVPFNYAVRRNPEA